MALEDAGVGAGRVDVVFADGAGVPATTRREAEALRGSSASAPRGARHRAQDDGGPRCTPAAPRSTRPPRCWRMRDGVIPPTINLERPATAASSSTPAGRSADVRNALVVARGYGGFNSALVLRRDT